MDPLWAGVPLSLLRCTQRVWLGKSKQNFPAPSVPDWAAASLLPDATPTNEIMRTPEHQAVVAAVVGAHHIILAWLGGQRRERTAIFTHTGSKPRAHPPSYAFFSGIYRKTLKSIVPRGISRDLKAAAKTLFSRKSAVAFSLLTFNTLADIFDSEITRTSELTGLNLEAWRARR